jgi:nucleoside-diphosphate-sugar epimerase
MRIFVTGASGYIGGAVARALARRGHEVSGLVRSEQKARELEKDEISGVVGDLQKPAGYAAAAKAAVLSIHCAVDYTAHAGLDRSAVDTLLGSGGSLIYTSGVWLYGDTGPRTVDESTALQEGHVVPWRLSHEKLVLAAATAKRRTLVLRPGCVYGGRGGLTGMWFESAAKKKASAVAGPGRNRWAMIHVEDLAEVYARAAESSVSGELLNATDHSRETVLEMAQAASKAAGAGGNLSATTAAQARKQYGALAEGLLLDQQVDSSKAEKLLGWTPRYAGFSAGAARFHRAWKAAQG